jgi:hypothetical protein
MLFILVVGWVKLTLDASDNLIVPLARPVRKLQRAKIDDVMRLALGKHLTIKINPFPLTFSELLIIHGVSTCVPDSPPPHAVSLLFTLYSNPHDNKSNRDGTTSITRIAPGCLPKQAATKAKDNQWKDDIAENRDHIACTNNLASMRHPVCTGITSPLADNAWHEWHSVK